MTSTAELVPIEDPDFYLSDPWPTFARLRQQTPFYFYEPLDTFVVTRHADIREIGRYPTVFVNSKGLFLNDVKYQAETDGELLTDSFFPRGGEQVGTSDPPRHQELRRVIAPAFSAAAMGAIQGPLSEDIERVVNQIASDEPVDWIKYASLVPIKAASRLIGLPDADVHRIQFWSDELEKLGGDLSFDELRAAAREFATLQSYIAEILEAKRRDPGDGDLITILLDQELDNEKVSPTNVVMFSMTMLAAGSDTTRSLLAGLIHELARHPEHWVLLREDRSRIALAVEETLRWVTPARAFLRTATADIVINGQPVAAGQHVYLMYMAANRDESVFPNADCYDITRPESVRHLSFGTGPHSCPGPRLVRLEAPIVLNALLDRFSSVELAAKPTPVRHIIRNSWSSMPVIFRS